MTSADTRDGLIGSEGLDGLKSAAELASVVSLIDPTPLPTIVAKSPRLQAQGSLSVSVSVPSYRIYGLNVDSDIPLSALAAESGDPDLILRLGAPRPIPEAPADGSVLSALNPDTRFGQSLVETRDGSLCFRVHGVVEYCWHPDRRRVTCHLAPDRDDAWASVFSCSSFLALWLVLRGRAPLHASAVTNGTASIAFAGHSHQGKSTLAYAAWRGGATVLSDDVLATTFTEGAVYALAGSLQIRLRDDSRDPEGRSLPRSIDERYFLSFNTAPERVPLSAIIVPVISDETREIRIERLPGFRAFAELSQYPRGIGREQENVKMQVFRLMADLSSWVPVYRAYLPRGVQKDPAFPARVAGWLESPNVI